LIGYKNVSFALFIPDNLNKLAIQKLLCYNGYIGGLMSEELLKKITELEVENAKLNRRNKLLRKRLHKLKISHDEDEIDLASFTKNYISAAPEIVGDRCPKCNAELDAIDMNNGTLFLCTKCNHREFTK
jgi:uncharacterized protein with PIN domain